MKTQKKGSDGKNCILQTKMGLDHENLILQNKAFKLENSRLVKENNELHREILEVKKSKSSLSSSKDVEIKRLREEKNEFKFLYTETREKMNKVISENGQMKMKMLSIMHRIYERNMDENSLRKMFEEGERQFQLAKIEDLEQGLGIFIKPKGLSMNMNINFTPDATGMSGFSGRSKSNFGNVDNSSGFSNPNMLKEIIKETFGKLEEEKADMTYNSKNDNTSLKVSGSNNFFPDLVTQLQEKIDSLESELVKSKNSSLVRNEISNNETDQLVIRYLKDENSKLIEKYEHRLDLLAVDNRNYEKVNKEISLRLKKFENYHPYIRELEEKLKDLNQKYIENKNIYEVYEKQISDLRLEKQNLKVEIENCKKLVISNISEDTFNKLKEDYQANQILVNRLDQRMQEITSTSNTTQGFLMNEIKEIKANNQNLNLEVDRLNKEILNLKKENEDLLENSNMMKMTILQKEGLYNEQLEKVEEFSQEIIKVEIEKQKLNNQIKEMNEQILLLKKEIIILNNYSDRMKNERFMMQKQIEILEIKLGGHE